MSPSELIRLALDRQSQTPFYRQIYQRFSGAIAQGILRPGERLPSARSLASQLSTSRGTVDLAYSLLSGEGYILSQGAAGTIVAAMPTVAPGLFGSQPPPKPARVDPSAERPAVAPFEMGLPAFDVFPRKLWSRLATRHARTLPLHAMASPSPIGYMPLREAIASYLAVSRGILCSPGQVFVTSGFQSAIGLITRAFLQPGEDAWVEDPGYFLARMGLEAAGANIVPVPVDAEGLNVSEGIARSPRARFAFVTPAHQAPLGVALSVPRRLALLSWAASAEAWIVEDDYDSEFRYGSPPLPALKSLDEAARVLYVGSFSKVLFPGLRLGYIVIPESQIDRLSRVCRLLYRDRPIFNQAIVADFMLEGHFARHIRRMRKLYSDRRSALAAALAEVFGGRIDVHLQAGGMHLLARFTDGESDLDLAARANAHGLAPAPLSPWNVGSDCGQGLLLSFTNIPREAAIHVATQLQQAITPG